MLRVDTVYLLRHSYEYEFDGETFDETKILGIYSSIKRVQQEIDYHKGLEGFRDYPEECFVFGPYTLDGSRRPWDGGFVDAASIGNEDEDDT